MPDFGFDAWIDSQLRNVPLPPDLLSRLAENGPEPSAETKLEMALRNVPVPDSLEWRLRRIARLRRSTPWWSSWGIAAALFACMGLAVMAYVNFSAPAIAPPQEIARAEPLTQERTVQTPRAAPFRRTLAPPTPPAATTQGVSLDFETKGTGVISSLEGSTFENDFRPLFLGAAARVDRLPELEVLARVEHRGISPPRLPGYDLLFQLKHGEHPFVSPAAHPDLAISYVPFTFRTTSYDAALVAARSGHMPSPDDIRVEDFLAAIKPLLPLAPPGGLALHAAGTRSPFANEGKFLVGLTVQAATLQNIRHSPTRLIVAIDWSSEMRAGMWYEAVRRGLAQLAAEMSPADRLTLVAYAEQPRVWAENATAAELQSLVSSAGVEPPAGIANFGAAVEAVVELAAAVPVPGRQAVVFLTAPRLRLDQATRSNVLPMLTSLTDRELPWEVVRVGASNSDSVAGELAEWGLGKVAGANSGADISRTLLEKLIGQATTVAADASLKLSFNPRVVTGYRLLGHDAATLTGVISDPLVVDFHGGQTASVLYELFAKSTGDDVVAIAELTWRDPRGGQPRRIVRPIRRKQLDGTFSLSPAWLQQGLIAAKTAEALRKSYYAPNPRPFTQILEVASQADPRVTEQSEFRRLLELLNLAPKLR